MSWVGTTLILSVAGATSWLVGLGAFVATAFRPPLYDGLWFVSSISLMIAVILTAAIAVRIDHEIDRVDQERFDHQYGTEAH